MIRETCCKSNNDNPSSRNRKLPGNTDTGTGKEKTKSRPFFLSSFFSPWQKKISQKKNKKKRISRFIRLYSPICCHRKYREENLSTVYIFSSFQSSHHSHFFNHLFFFSFDLFLLADHIKSFTCGKLYYRTSYLDAKRDVLYVGAMWVIYSVTFFFISFWFISISSTRAILFFFVALLMQCTIPRG